jgi:hypothetical protein
MNSLPFPCPRIISKLFLNFNLTVKKAPLQTVCRISKKKFLDLDFHVVKHEARKLTSSRERTFFFGSYSGQLRQRNIVSKNSKSNNRLETIWNLSRKGKAELQWKNGPVAVGKISKFINNSIPFMWQKPIIFYDRKSFCNSAIKSNPFAINWKE